MSTRSGEYVTLRQLRRRKSATMPAASSTCCASRIRHLDFDLDLAKSQTNENPVYYVQYAHARICSVLAQWDGDPAELAETDLSPLTIRANWRCANKLAEFRERHRERGARTAHRT
jgi:arginyl-tRNA synthetase